MTANRKQIIFEGREVGLSETMKKIQRDAENLTSSIYKNYNANIKSSKEFIENLNKEAELQQKLQRVSTQDRRYEILEKHKQALEEINKKEEERYNRLVSRGVGRDDARQQAEDYGKDLKRVADTQKREDLSFLSEQAKEQRTTNELLKTLIEQNNLQWEQEVREDREGVKRFIDTAKRTGIENLSDEDKAKVAFQQALISEQDTGGQRGRNVFTDIIGAQLVRDLGGIIGQMPNARDAFDLVPGITRMTGAGLGAGAGALAGATVLNPAGGASVGAEIGQRAGEVAGNALARFFNEREQLESASLRARAVTGIDFGDDFAGVDFTRFGSTRAQSAQILQQMARASGSTVNDLEAMLGTETGFGIEQGTLMGAARGTRRTGGDFGQEIRNLIGVAEQQGIDRVLLNDFIANQNQMVMSLGSMVENVDPRNMAAIMLELNQLGGGFSVQDPRSQGFIGSLQGGLTNVNDFGRAQNLSVLRGMDPSAGLLDLLEMEEQGLGGERGREFLSGTIEQFERMFGGNEDLMVLALRSRFPGIPIADLRRLARGEDVIGSMRTEDMDAMVDVTGQDNVSRRAIMSAEVSDAFATGAIEGMEAINDQMAGLFSQAFQKAMIDVDVEDMFKRTASKFKMGVRNLFKGTE